MHRFFPLRYATSASNERTRSACEDGSSAMASPRRGEASSIRRGVVTAEAAAAAWVAASAAVAAAASASAVSAERGRKPEPAAGGRGVRFGSGEPWLDSRSSAAEIRCERSFWLCWCSRLSIAACSLSSRCNRSTYIWECGVRDMGSRDP